MQGLKMGNGEPPQRSAVPMKTSPQHGARSAPPAYPVPTPDRKVVAILDREDDERIAEQWACTCGRIHIGDGPHRRVRRRVRRLAAVVHR